MQQSRRNEWAPPELPPHANGHDLQHGSMLGVIMNNGHHQIRLLERLGDQLDELPERIARALPPPPSTPTPPPSSTPPSNPLSLREWVYLIAAGLIAVGAITGQPLIKEAGQSMTAIGSGR